MDDFAMQNDRPSCRTNVRELPVVRLGHPNRAVRMTTVLVRCESLLIGSICLGSHGFAPPVKVVVRLVSFPLSGVRNDLASELRSAA